VANIKQHYSDEGVWMGSAGNVVLAIWGPDPTVQRIKESAESQRIVLKEHGSLISFSLIPQLSSRMPKLGADERAAIKDIVNEFGAHSKASANVVEGTGFWMSAARAILTGVALLGRSPSKTFGAVAPAAEWLCETGYVSLAGGSAALAAAMEEARATWMQQFPQLRAVAG
jgi:hypothetical protein